MAGNTKRADGRPARKRYNADRRWETNGEIKKEKRAKGVARRVAKLARRQARKTKQAHQAEYIRVQPTGVKYREMCGGCELIGSCKKIRPRSESDVEQAIAGGYKWSDICHRSNNKFKPLDRYIEKNRRMREESFEIRHSAESAE